MKKMLALISFLFLTLNAFSQDSNLTIIAVGDADQEKDVLVFTPVEFNDGVSDVLKRKVSEVKEIILKDFGFYKHKFEIKNSSVSNSYTSFNLEKLKEEAPSYIITWRFEGGESENLKTKIFRVSDSSFIFDGSISLNIAGEPNRRIAHLSANRIYKAITQKESIFNSKIVFVSDIHSTRNDIRKELYLMDFDGERKQRLTFNNSMIISPSISPDNSKILYSVMESRWQKGSDGKPNKVKNLNLYLLDLITKKSQVVSNKVGINSGAIFDHSGQNIYLTLSTTGNADIYKMNLATHSLTKVTGHYSDDVDPSINQDGSLMTFLSGRSGRAMIYVLDPSGVEKNVKRISYVGKYNAAPRFSPDGKEIVFSSWVDNSFDLYKIDSNGTNLVRLTKNFGSNEEANFSPDGEFIVFTSQKVISSSKALQNVYIMNRDGEIVAQITENFGKSFSPRWSN